jgi:hypothetical protein
MNVAPCLFDDCSECALREIEASDLSEYACHGGVDILTFVFHPPCATCHERLFPATQDYQHFELDQFLTEPAHTETTNQVDTVDDLNSRLIWGESNPQMVEDVMNDVNEVQSRWPRVSLPVEEEKEVEAEDDQMRTFRFYKPFGKVILPDEVPDFKSFLSIIF